jgi:hypothetical protein
VTVLKDFSKNLRIIIISKWNILRSFTNSTAVILMSSTNVRAARYTRATLHSIPILKTNTQAKYFLFELRLLDSSKNLPSLPRKEEGHQTAYKKVPWIVTIHCQHKVT